MDAEANNRKRRTTNNEGQAYNFKASPQQPQRAGASSSSTQQQQAPASHKSGGGGPHHSPPPSTASSASSQSPAQAQAHAHAQQQAQVPSAGARQKRELWVIQRRSHGNGAVNFAWHPDGNWVATVGINNVVNLWDRTGAEASSVALNTPCLGMDWDTEGEILAILSEGSSSVTFWDSHTRKSTSMECGLKENLCCLKWTVEGKQLAICSDRGSLVLYNKRNEKKITLQGKHSSKIIDVAWSKDNFLALSSEDKQISVSDGSGVTIGSFDLKSTPRNLQWSRIKTDVAPLHKQNVVSFIAGTKTLYLYNIEPPASLVDIAFQPKYGNIVKHVCYGDGYIMVGFSLGFFVAISTNMSEIGHELFSVEMFHSDVMDVSYNESLRRVAVCGEDKVRILDTKTWKATSDGITINKDRGAPLRIDWTCDGQMLGVSTAGGYFSTLLTKPPLLHASYNSKCAYLSSLRTITVLDVVARCAQVEIELPIEPTFLAVGPKFVVAGMNNQALYYPIDPPSSKPINDTTYMGIIDCVFLNTRWAALMFEGKVMLHLVDKSDKAENEILSKQFPEKEDSSTKISCISLNENFLIYGTSTGFIVLFHLQEWAVVSKFKLPDVGIKQVVGNAQGTRIAIIDTANKGSLYNPVNDFILSFPDWSEETYNILWDITDPYVLVTSDKDKFYTYTYLPVSISGPQLNRVSITQRSPALKPILGNNGVLLCQDLTTSVLNNVFLASHGSGAPQDKRTQFAQSLRLNHLNEGWNLAKQINTEDCFRKLGIDALRQLDIPLAIKAYRHLGDAGMVMTLEKIEYAEETQLLAGHVELLFGHYNEAQKLFLASSQPILALQMRRDLLHWDQALSLAKALAPDLLPVISIEYANQLEFKGEYKAALEMYKEGANGLSADSDQALKCKGGIVRMSLRVGDIVQGTALAIKLGNPQLLRESAQILESMNQFQEAAQLYHHGGLHDKAASIFLKSKNYGPLKEIMASVTSPALHSLYAKAKEEQGDIAEAERAYTRAQDFDNVIRIILKSTTTPERAFAIVRKTGSQSGAKLAAEFCKDHDDFRSAIEFLYRAHLDDEAFTMAQQHSHVDVYADVIGESGTTEQYTKIAAFFEAHGDFQAAGNFYALCGQYPKALDLFIRCGSSAILSAIRMVGKARDNNLTSTLQGYLLGTADGVPKDPNNIFRLFMALGEHLQAARTAIIIARQEQLVGNYTTAHKVILETFRILVANKIKVLPDLRRTLCLLHSYLLAKTLISRKFHEAGARMLVRVARNISKFPTYTVQILVSTVLECQIAGMNKTAFEFASILVSEYREHIPQKYKLKIEGIVRKMDKTESPEKTTPCPNCNTPLFRTELDCPNCKSFLPFCIVTGRHMVIDDWTNCPFCEFPALFKHFTTHAAAGLPCPMCDKQIDPNTLIQNPNPMPLLKRDIESVDINSLQPSDEQSFPLAPQIIAAAAAAASSAAQKKATQRNSEPPSQPHTEPQSQSQSQSPSQSQPQSQSQSQSPQTQTPTQQQRIPQQHNVGKPTQAHSSPSSRMGAVAKTLSTRPVARTLTSKTNPPLIPISRNTNTTNQNQNSNANTSTYPQQPEEGQS
ncbi:WD repeat membrane protein [Pelomyxa schiedti]|nr:WD repeat membrane protein [Pelomyxa schiedti]